jgi:hypothetical protein
MEMYMEESTSSGGGGGDWGKARFADASYKNNIYGLF